MVASIEHPGSVALAAGWRRVARVSFQARFPISFSFVSSFVKSAPLAFGYGDIRFT